MSSIFLKDLVEAEKLAAWSIFLLQTIPVATTADDGPAEEGERFISEESNIRPLLADLAGWLGARSSQFDVSLITSRPRRNLTARGYARRSEGLDVPRKSLSRCLF